MAGRRTGPVGRSDTTAIGDLGQQPDGGYDDLHADGVHLNQGARSTLAVISTSPASTALIDCAAVTSRGPDSSPISPGSRTCDTGNYDAVVGTEVDLLKTPGGLRRRGHGAVAVGAAGIAYRLAERCRFSGR